MTYYYSTRDLGVMRDAFALPHRKQFVVPFVSEPIKTAALSPREISLVRSLIEDRHTILWLDENQQITSWDMDDGVQNEHGIILVL